jgi:Subtilase family
MKGVVLELRDPDGGSCGTGCGSRGDACGADGASAVRDRLTPPLHRDTSAAAATVAGAAALLKLRDPSLTAEALKARLTLSASPPRGLKCIHGRLNLADARTRY